MTPSVEFLDRAIFVTGILSAIGITAVALWGSYFEAHLEKISKGEEKVEKAQELGRIRVIGFFAFVFQVIVFFSNSNARKTHPMLTVVIFFVALLIQGQIQNKLEKKLDYKDDSSQGQAAAAVKSLVWLGASIVGYLLTVYACSLGLYFLSQTIGLEKEISGLAALLGAVVGLFLGFIFFFALSPYFMRKTLPVKILAEEKTLVLIRSCFEKAGFSCPDVYFVDVDKISNNNVLLAGFRRGNGIFKQSLFLTKPFINGLTEKELEAIILREVSHSALNHIKKRLFVGVSAVILTVVLSSVLVALSLFVFPPAMSSLVRLVIPVFAFIAPFLTIKNTIRKQEAEADYYVVAQLGISLAAFASALRKIDNLNQASLLHESDNSVGSFQTEKRIVLLRQRLDETASTEKKTEQDDFKKAA